MTFRWRADDGPLIVVFGFAHQLNYIKNVIEVGTPLTNLSGSAHGTFDFGTNLCLTKLLFNDPNSDQRADTSIEWVQVIDL